MEFVFYCTEIMVVKENLCNCILIKFSVLFVFLEINHYNCGVHFNFNFYEKTKFFIRCIGDSNMPYWV
mgnify:FL=1|jgi:hypothetical protein